MLLFVVSVDIACSHLYFMSSCATVYRRDSCNSSLARISPHASPGMSWRCYIRLFPEVLCFLGPSGATESGTRKPHLGWDGGGARWTRMIISDAEHCHVYVLEPNDGSLYCSDGEGISVELTPRRLLSWKLFPLHCSSIVADVVHRELCLRHFCKKWTVLISHA